jgi:hypothetical protein
MGMNVLHGGQKGLAGIQNVKTAVKALRRLLIELCELG